MGVHYTQTVSNRDPDDVLNASAHAFYDSCISSFNHTNFEGFTYLERIGGNDTRNHYVKAVKQKQHAATAVAPVILEPRFTPFSERTGDSGTWVLASFFIGAFALLIMVLAPPLKEAL